MKHIVKNHEELEKKIAELVKGGYKQADITEHELVFTKGLHARDTIYPTFWYYRLIWCFWKFRRI